MAFFLLLIYASDFSFMLDSTLRIGQCTLGFVSSDSSAFFTLSVIGTVFFPFLSDPFNSLV